MYEKEKTDVLLKGSERGRGRGRVFILEIRRVYVCYCVRGERMHELDGQIFDLANAFHEWKAIQTKDITTEDG